MPIRSTRFWRIAKGDYCELIEHATGKAAYEGTVEEEGEDVEIDEDGAEAELTIGVP